MSDVLLVMGGVLDVNGEKGLDEGLLNDFPVRTQKWLTWKEQEPITSFASNIAQAATAIEPLFSEIDRKIYQRVGMRPGDHYNLAPHP